jgi:hypothetical protein
VTAFTPLEIPSLGQLGPLHNFYSAHPNRHCPDDDHWFGQSVGLSTNDESWFPAQAETRTDWDKCIWSMYVDEGNQLLVKGHVVEWLSGA